MERQPKTPIPEGCSPFQIAYWDLKPVAGAFIGWVACYMKQEYPTWHTARKIANLYCRGHYPKARMIRRFLRELGGERNTWLAIEPNNNNTVLGFTCTNIGSINTPIRITPRYDCLYDYE